MEKAFIIYGETIKPPRKTKEGFTIPLGEGFSSAIQITDSKKVKELRENIKTSFYETADTNTIRDVLMFVCCDTDGELIYHSDNIVIPARKDKPIYFLGQKEKTVIAQKFFEDLWQ